MAIVDMKKISVIGLVSYKNQILELLMRRGFVQIDDSSLLKEETELTPFLEKDSEETAVLELEQLLYQTGQAVALLEGLGKVKKSFLAPKDTYKDISHAQAEQTHHTVTEVNDLDKQIHALKASFVTLENNKALLLPWTSFDVPLGSLKTKKTITILGTLPVSAEVGAIREKLDVLMLPSVVGELKADKMFRYLYVISHKDTFDAVTDILKEFGFLAVSFHNEKESVSDAIRDYDTALEKKQQEIEALTKKLQSFAGQLSELQNLYDYYTIRRDEKKEFSKLARTRAAFHLNGWVPAKKAVRLEKELAENFECVVEMRSPEKDENFPILLQNNSFVTPFESVTNMYSCPGPGDIDPNPIMAVFYTIFFGMMLSDAGYGIIIALACGFIIWKGKMKKGEGNMFKMLAICGVSTAVWGVIFGGAFGDLIPMKPIISPLDDVMILMAMSLLFGILHIYVGMGIKAYNLIRQGKALDALFDVGLWLVFISGVCLLVIPVVAGDIGIFSEIGKYLAIIGAAGLVLTQGRAFKGIFMKGFKGVSSLYDITSYFADILSYTRLMALCLSTGVIGQVINLLGKIAGPIPAIFIGVIGHTANLLINALGAYVHTSRLQYVEFFGKFFEGGGTPFQPLKYKTKYTKVN